MQITCSLRGSYICVDRIGTALHKYMNLHIIADAVIPARYGLMQSTSHPSMNEAR